MKVKAELMTSFGWARYRGVWITSVSDGWLFSAEREELGGGSSNYIGRPYPTAYGAASAGLAWKRRKR